MTVILETRKGPDWKWENPFEVVPPVGEAAEEVEVSSGEEREEKVEEQTPEPEPGW